MSATLVLAYDDFHTPLRELAETVGDAVVLHVRLGGRDGEPRVAAGQRIRVVDACERFCDGYLVPAVKANAVYGGGYALSAALARPLLAEVCADVARDEGAATVVHGFAGNDQLRFEMAMRALAPELALVPVAALIGSRNSSTGHGPTVSDNLWGRSVEAGPLSDPGRAAPAAVLGWCDPDARAVEKHRVRFERGRPVALDGEALPMRALVEQLNAAGARTGAGLTDTVEDGFVGLKTRAVYEAPAAAALIAAHGDLERLVSSRRQNHFKPLVDRAWAELVYDGLWFDPQRRSLDAYVDEVNARVSGEVELVLGPGGVRVAARSAPAALYDEREAVYRIGQDVGVEALPAVAELVSAPMRAAARRNASATETSAWNG